MLGKRGIPFKGEIKTAEINPTEKLSLGKRIKSRKRGGKASISDEIHTYKEQGIFLFTYLNLGERQQYNMKSN